jgi:tetratricopeptide (TPR) repeat protein
VLALKLHYIWLSGKKSQEKVPYMSDTPENDRISDESELPESDTLRYNLDSLDDYIDVSEQVAREGRLDEAVDVLREATQRYPESPTGQYNLGVALFLRVKQDREHLELWENLADDEQFASEAIDALEAAIAADAGFVQAYNNLGRLYALKGRRQEACDTWEKSLKLNPEQPEIRADLDVYRDKISPRAEDIEVRELMDSEKPDRNP